MKKKFLVSVFVLVCLQNIFSDFYKVNVTASYYAEAFHGKKTSNGETFNMYALTCAHKSLPFNTVCRVTNLRNGKSVQVRVNDRGPFVASREMDLSRAAAVQLDMIKTGTAKVNIQIISLGSNTKMSRQTAVKACKKAGISYPGSWSNSIKTASSPSVSSVAKTEAKTGKTVSSSKANEKVSADTLWDIQVGAFSSRTNANEMAQKLLKQGFSDVVFQTAENSSVVRVVIRKIKNGDLESVEKKLRENGWSGFVVKKRSL